jgi:hypothetical protein
MIDQSFDDNSHVSFELHHLFVIEVIDFAFHTISVIHQRAEHDDMLRRLSFSAASTRSRLHFEHLSSM